MRIVSDALIPAPACHEGFDQIWDMPPPLAPPPLLVPSLHTDSTGPVIFETVNPPTPVT
jgi:hypothetical protein